MCAGVCRTQRRGEKRQKTGRREQEKRKALSSETADRLTGLLRPTETNIWRQSERDKGRDGERQRH